MLEAIAFPFDSDFKMKILGILLRDRSFVHQHRHILDSRHFDNPIQERIAKEILFFFDTFGVTPTDVSLFQRLCEEEHFELYKVMIKKINEVDLSDADYVKLELRNYCKQQAFRLAMYKAEMFLKMKEYDKILPEFERAALTGEDALLDGFRLGESQERVKEYLSMDHRVETRVATLIRRVDHILRGGVGPGELHMIFAPTKRGKSIFLVNLAYACALQGKKATYVSLELSDIQVATRMNMRLSGMTDDELAVSPLVPEAGLGRYEQYQKMKWVRRFKKCLSTGGDVYFKNFPTKSLKLDRLQYFLDKLWKVEGFSTDLLIVDYLDLLKSDRSYDDTWKGQGPLAEGLRGIAGEMNIPCWTATQGGKHSGAKDQLTEEDVKGDSIKNDTADSLWSLIQSKEEESCSPQRGRLKCNLLREGFGMGEVLPVRFEKDKMLITSLEEYSE